MKRKIALIWTLFATLFLQSASAESVRDVLPAFVMLKQGESLSNDHYELDMQTDGNLVLYRKNVNSPIALWATNVYGNYAVVQGDGNFVVYNNAGVAVWNSGTYGEAATYQLELLSDGELNLTKFLPAGNRLIIWRTPADTVTAGCPNGSSPQKYPVCIGGMTFNLPMCSQADAANYAHQNGGYYGACH